MLKLTTKSLSADVRRRKLCTDARMGPIFSSSIAAGVGGSECCHFALSACEDAYGVPGGVKMYEELRLLSGESGPSGAVNAARATTLSRRSMVQVDSKSQALSIWKAMMRDMLATEVASEMALPAIDCVAMR